MPKPITLILISAAVVAGCGPSSQPTAGKTAGAYSQALEFSKCMRAHGVSNFPDPSTHGGGIQFSVTGGKRDAPALQSAQASCRHLLPGGGPGAGPKSAQAHAQLLQVAECMRAHGISGFPDPTTGAPPAPGAGFGLVIGRGGYFLAVPSSIDARSPAFQQAASACGFGPKGGPPGGGD